jgi:chaperone BCS1
MKVERDRQQTSVDINMGHPFETIKFTCLGQDKEIFSQMLNYAKDLELAKHDGKLVIYEPRTSDWEPFGEPRRRREFESVILDRDMAERILADVLEFLDSRDWYEQRGVPYRRGYLLHGPPGCGKTSYIMALAGKLEYDICQMNLSNSALSDERLGYLLNVAPPKSIILLEDIDAAFLSREDIDLNRSAYQGLGRVTLSGMLNVLDGVASSEGRILFMTTNYPEKLDPALTRPGRVDMKYYIGYASNEQLVRAFERFYPPNESGVSGKDFVDAIESAKKLVKLPKRKKIELSMADVQSYFLLHKDDPHGAIQSVSGLIATKAANLSSSPNGFVTAHV